MFEPLREWSSVRAAAGKRLQHWTRPPLCAAGAMPGSFEELLAAKQYAPWADNYLPYKARSAASPTNSSRGTAARARALCIGRLATPGPHSRSSRITTPGRFAQSMKRLVSMLKVETEAPLAALICAHAGRGLELVQHAAHPRPRQPRPWARDGARRARAVCRGLCQARG